MKLVIETSEDREYAAVYLDDNQGGLVVLGTMDQNFGARDVFNNALGILDELAAALAIEVVWDEGLE